MPVPLLQVHTLAVVLFLLLFGGKALLLFLNRHQVLQKARRYTKMLDAVFGGLVLLTGAWLALASPTGWPTWLWVKMVLVVASVPLAIIGLKKHSKPLAAVALLLLLYIFGIAETRSLELRSPKSTTADHLTLSKSKISRQEKAVKTPNPILNQLAGTQLENTAAIYRQLCATCHGLDGKQNIGGAPDLTESTLSAPDRQTIIANGQGLMPGYRSQLTEQEIVALAEYTTLLQ